ncbi:MAG TPA: hypothetical protein DEB40_08900 [Elusimicrobia bacterium]|nr:hypothetical protein [Elusimicrobiota bacterium]HBT61846.1 hypothetical protein [Elusimicrobiota bacterium]
MFQKAASSPILAAAGVDDTGPRETKAWNNRSISGVPPRTPEGSLETPIKTIYPALAIKLAPPSTSEISVSEFLFTRDTKKCVARFSAWGENIAEAWIESSNDGLDWERVSKIRRRQPFIFSITDEKCPASGYYLRGAVRDILGSTGLGEPYRIPYANP